MPSPVVSARVPPYVHAKLTERAAERGTSLAAVATEALTAACDTDGPAARTAGDGPLVAAVRRVLEAVDASDPRAEVDRELCLLLALTIERGGAGYLAAVVPFRNVLKAALPPRHDPVWDAILAAL